MPSDCRLFSLADLPAVLDLETRCFADDAYNWSDFLDLYDMGSDTFLVVEDDGELLGYIVAYQDGDEGYIVSIAVAPHSRRQGIGQTLIEAVVQRLRDNGVQLVGLHVRTTNSPALELYRKLGFTIAVTEPNYYGQNQPAYYMHRLCR